MAKKARIANTRAARAVKQRLESLQRAGVTHIPRVPWEEPSAQPATAATPTVHRPTVEKKATPAATPRRAAQSQPPAASSTLPLVTQGEFHCPSVPDDDPRVKALSAIAAEVAACRKCAQLAGSRTQTVFGIGNPYAQLVFLGEAPGKDEDEQGIPFVGRAGKLLTDIIQKGMKLPREDVFIMNILRCRPPGNRNPLPDEAAACRTFVDRTLGVIQPKWICCLGAIAAQYLLATPTPIGQMRGQIVDYQGIRVVCTYHPAYLLRNPAAKAKTWEDIKVLMDDMGLKR